MAYFKRYNSNRRRRRSTLSTKNIVSRKSASSQSRQILSLRNRISKVERDSRPEIQLHEISDSKTFTNSSLADTNFQWIVSLPGSSMTGQWVNSRGLGIRGVVEYSDNYQTNVAVDHQRTCSFRFIVFSSKASSNSVIPLQNLVNINAAGTGYELNAIRPMKKGITSYAKIYYDKTFIISSQNPIRKFYISLKKIKNLHKETSDIHPRGEIQFGIITSGLHFDSTYNQQIKLSFISTYSYNDVN